MSTHYRFGRLWLGVCSAALGAFSCIGSTGGTLFEFETQVAGAEGAENGQYTFVSGRGYDVTLTTATIHIGAIYLNQSVPTSVASDTSCALAGIYVAEVHAGIEVDALDPAPKRLEAAGVTPTDRARTGELWLTSGDINASSDPTVVARVAGVATKDGETCPFEGSLTISTNRKAVASDPALPGAKPICKQRVVSPISLDATPTEGGTLLLRVDPAGWFGNVDFSQLEQVGEVFEFQDDDSDAPSRNLYAGIHANAGVYSIDWIESGAADD